MTPIEKEDVLLILQSARDVLALPGRWTKISSDDQLIPLLARDTNNLAVTSCAPEACKWSLVGALVVARADLLDGGAAFGASTLHLNAIDVVRKALPRNSGLMSFNDAQRSVGPVLAALDLAIEMFSHEKP